MIQPVSDRPLGISAFVRCQNEEEYIVASLLSLYRFVDEILVILNNSTDRTRALVEDLMGDRPNIHLAEYDSRCEPAGVGYLERVRENPAGSLAAYYNWCLERTRYSHAFKWDGDMIALPALGPLRAAIAAQDVVLVDGYDAVGAPTTALEPRVFRYESGVTRYVDWDLYEILTHQHSRVAPLAQPAYLHMKLVKREWIHRPWVSPNEFAVRSPPDTGAAGERPGVRKRLVGRLKSLVR